MEKKVSISCITSEDWTSAHVRNIGRQTRVQSVEALLNNSRHSSEWPESLEGSMETAGHHQERLLHWK